MTEPKLKILLLGAGSSIHVQRWVNALLLRGHRVHLVTQHPSDVLMASPGFSLSILPFKGKWGYVLNARAFSKHVEAFKPDIIHAHYASGYGLMASLSRKKPLFLSVWGSDVYDFPYQSRLNTLIIRWNLKNADAVASTSQVMVQQVENLVPQLKDQIFVTPFGVDLEQFKPRTDVKVSEQITIGTVKTLAEKYGIDTLISAFALLTQDPQLKELGLVEKLRLVIVGGGPLRGNLEQLALELGIQDKTEFVGQVEHETVPDWLRKLDVYVAASRQESFGVAVLEASACAIPVIVGNVGGLPEVVNDQVTGFVVEPDRPDLIAEKCKAMILSKELRSVMALEGRKWVEREYAWDECVDHMIRCYLKVIHK
jgi:glycosyltransferase involved in cell wall biosynthesis